MSKDGEGNQQVGAHGPRNKSYYRKFGIGGIVTSAAIIYGSYKFGSFIPVPPSLNVATKLGYTCKWLVFPALNVFIAVQESGFARDKHNAHPLAGKDHLFQVQKNVLMNTLEQFSVFAFPVLALGASVRTENELRLIPALCITFFIARIMYRVGYPDHRVLAFAMGSATTFFSFGANAYLALKYGILSGIDS